MKWTIKSLREKWKPNCPKTEKLVHLSNHIQCVKNRCNCTFSANQPKTWSILLNDVWCAWSCARANTTPRTWYHIEKQKKINKWVFRAAQMICMNYAEAIYEVVAFAVYFFFSRLFSLLEPRVFAVISRIATTLRLWYRWCGWHGQWNTSHKQSRCCVFSQLQTVEW